MVEVQSAPQAVHQITQQDPDTSTSTVFSAELSTINSQLLNHGWTKRPLDLSALSTRDHNEVVSVLFELLGSSVTNVNNLEAMATRHRTLQYEFERIQKVNYNLKSTNTKLEQETNAWKVKCTETEKKLQLEELKTKELKEEIGRGRKALEGVRVAATHENKKIQLKLDKSLAQISRQSENPQQKSTGLVLLNPIPAGRIQPIASTASPLLEQTLRDLTDIRESLQEETEAFRHVVLSTGNALREALAASQGKEAPPRLMQSQFFTLNTSSLRQSHLNQTSTFQSSSSTSHPSMANTRLQALISEIRVRLVENAPPPLPVNGILVPTPEEIEEQKRIEREQEKMRLDLEDRVKDLQVELICAKKKEQEASKVVEEMARKELEAATAKGDMEGILAKQLDIMDIERRTMKESKERLEKERKQLEIEKQNFEEEKRQAELDAVLALIPPPSDVPSSSVPEFGSEQEGEDVLQQTQIDQFAIPTSPGPSTYHKHLPHSPSPLSPLPTTSKPRTPKNHHASSLKNRRKSMKTPLSRLVLEKAVRQKSKDLTSDTTGNEKGLGSSVLGNERGRKTNTNLVPSTTTSRSLERNRVLSPSRKGKEREKFSNTSASLGIGFPPPPSLMKSVGEGPGKIRSTSSSSATSTSTSGGSLGTKTMRPSNGVNGLRTSLSGSTTGTTVPVRKVDLNKVGGIGPIAARKSKNVWR